MSGDGAWPTPSGAAERACPSHARLGFLSSERMSRDGAWAALSGAPIGHRLKTCATGDEAARGCPRQKLIEAAFFSNLGVRRGVRYG